MLFHFLKRLFGFKSMPRDYSDRVQILEHRRRIERDTQEVLDRVLQRGYRSPR